MNIKQIEKQLDNFSINEVRILASKLLIKIAKIYREEVLLSEGMLSEKEPFIKKLYEIEKAVKKLDYYYKKKEIK